MKVFTELARIRNIPPTAVALGNFDGVHLGHAELICRMAAHAHAHGLASAVFTFSNQPYNVIAGKTVIRGLATEEDKERLLGPLGVDYLFSFKFDEGFHSMTPSAFIDDLLLSAFCARAVFCGFNFRFGAKAAGNPELLREAGAEKGFDLIVMEPYRVDGELVSSTAIRGFVEEGDMASAAKFLGRPFTLSGEIIHGNGIGRSLGFPTANIAPPEGLVIPPYGVYVTESELPEDGDGAPEGDGTGGGRRKDGGKPSDAKAVAEGFEPVDRAECPDGLRSITNIGVRPTIGDEKLLVETHIFGAPDSDLYGRRIRVGFLSQLRAERKFPDVEALKAQVESDKRSALEYVRPHGDPTGDASIPEGADIHVTRLPQHMSVTDRSDDFIELLYIADGDCGMTVGDEDIDVGAGDLLLLAPGIEHGVRAYSDDGTVIRIMVRSAAFQKSFISLLHGGNLLADFFAHTIFGKSAQPYLLFPTGGDERLREGIFGMYAEARNKDSYSDRMLKVQFEWMCLHLLREHSKQMGLYGDVKDVKTAELLWYISDHIGEVSLSAMADAFGYSTGYLCRLIKKLTGTNFSGLVNRVRFDRACELLENSTIEIARIAQDVGYCDTSNFYKAFKKHAGTTPARYRSEARAKPSEG
ncbi:MAG: helix-turn-helix domain-containing protein [Clostridiales Family XIII bacterium]|jgi:riboflavin kinase/FMN adenylyltransferase|nr:helix-turn-helix domain-containing protein [Clostridiales Family XIII bacterium]